MKMTKELEKTEDLMKKIMLDIDVHEIFFKFFDQNLKPFLLQFTVVGISGKIVQ